MDDTMSTIVIPPDHMHRTIVLCFDGTQNKISDKLSNVARFFSLLDRGDPMKQLVYYQTGIGTYNSSSLGKAPIISTIAKTVDSIFATSIASHVKEGYRYLMDHYLSGDRICIFGFSRGAYTARALAAMLHKVGLLQRGNHRHIEYAWDAFTMTSPEGFERGANFKRLFGIEIKIEFVGVWDSVASVGWNGYGLPFTLGDTAIKIFRHALALDERRARFKVNAWVPEQTGAEGNDAASTTATPKTDMLEVWFAGCHSDIGGGNARTFDRHSLAKISLRWMVRECFITNTGIIFSYAALKEIGLDPYTLYPRVLPRPPPVNNTVDESKDGVVGANQQLTEEEEDLLDSRCEINDELEKHRWWWILEIFPLQQRFQKGDRTWVRYRSFNLGRPRFLPRQKRGVVMLHRSVKMRMDDDEKLIKQHGKYYPRADFSAALALGNVVWVD